MNKERMEDGLFYITINFAEKSFKTRIKRSQEAEALYRNAANYVESKIQEYRKRYPKQSIDTHLSLVSLELALELLKEREEKSSVYDQIGKLVKELEDNLKK